MARATTLSRTQITCWLYSTAIFEASHSLAKSEAVGFEFGGPCLIP